MASTRIVSLTMACLLGVACRAGGVPGPAPAQTSVVPVEPSPAPADRPAALPAAPLPTPPASRVAVGAPPAAEPGTWSPLVVTKPDLLAKLQAGGHSLAARLGHPDAQDLRALRSASPVYDRVVSAIEMDKTLAQARDPHAAVGEAKAHHIFDPRVLHSTRGDFELVAVVNRMDRAPQAGECGELRMIYRLSHASLDGRSRMPMTINLIFLQRGDCQQLALRWLKLGDGPVDVAALRDGPLSELGPLRRLEFNLQSVRWPAASRPGLGGHAEYVLRVFEVRDGEAIEQPLENTPTITMNGASVTRLRRLLRRSAAAIADGSLLLPPELLAVRSVSVSPRGSARIANRPFSQVLGRARRLFKGVDLGALGTPERAMRRLDTMSCKGCHQSRSVAGFHVVGEERSGGPTYNAVAQGLSPHMRAELPWRRRQLEAVAAGRSFTEPRPFAERGGDGGVFGAACGVAAGGFTDWDCGAGLTCVAFDGAGTVGACAPQGDAGPGDRLEVSVIYDHRKSFKDRVSVKSRRECTMRFAGQSTEAAASGNGFPGGMCHAPCEQPGEVRGDVACGILPFTVADGGRTFSQCIFRDRRPVAECTREAGRPTWLRRCDLSTPCREDYLCARMPRLPAGSGACVPPYFLGQLRVDGHGLSFEAPRAPPLPGVRRSAQ